MNAFFSITLKFELEHAAICLNTKDKRTFSAKSAILAIQFMRCIPFAMAVSKHNWMSEGRGISCIRDWLTGSNSKSSSDARVILLALYLDIRRETSA